MKSLLHPLLGYFIGSMLLLPASLSAQDEPPPIVLPTTTKPAEKPTKTEVSAPKTEDAPPKTPAKGKSQSVSGLKIEPLTLPYTFVQLPYVHLPEDAKTYSVMTDMIAPEGDIPDNAFSMEIGELVKEGLGGGTDVYARQTPSYRFVRKQSEYENTYLVLPAPYTRVASDGDVRVVVEVEMLKIRQAKAKVRIDGKRSENGTDYAFACKTMLIFADKNGETIAQRPIRTDQFNTYHLVWDSDRYVNGVAADKAHLYFMYDKLSKSTYEDAQAVIEKVLPHPVTVSVVLYNISAKQAETYHELQQAQQLLREALADSSVARAKAAAAAEICVRNLAQADYENPQSVINERVAGVLNYHAALAFRLVDDYPNAKKCLAEVARSTSVDAPTLKAMTTLIQEAEKRYTFNHKAPRP
jgi:hypothetical protein